MEPDAHKSDYPKDSKSTDSPSEKKEDSRNLMGEFATNVVARVTLLPISEVLNHWRIPETEDTMKDVRKGPAFFVGNLAILPKTGGGTIANVVISGDATSVDLELRFRFSLFCIGRHKQTSKRAF